MMRDPEARAIEAMLAELPVVDCHEHTFLPDARPATVDLGTLISNTDMADDLISAGMPAAARLGLTYRSAAPYLDQVRNTGFQRSLIAAFRELFGFDGDAITAADWTALSAQLVAANARPDWYDEVLRRHGHITATLRIQGGEADPLGVDRRWFQPILRIDDWIVTADPAEREELASTVGGRASTLSDFLAALDAFFARAVQGGAVGIKSMLAYQRSLAFGPPIAADDAARLYDRTDRTDAEALALQDHLVHEVAARAGAQNMPWQIHVGIGSWQRNVVANGNPLMLDPLAEAHRTTVFVLLHGGYPYIGEMASMAKNHPNVVLECGWLAYIAPAVYRRAMSEWLDAVPAGKLLGVGADCVHVEQTLGALILTRRQLALALADKVRDADWPADLVESVASRLLGQNGRDLYRLDRRTEGGGERA